jgi:transcriptional regulator with XRE-family HTH domain
MGMKGGLLIREARLRAGLTQRALAERMGTSQPAVARWENGRQEPGFDTVVKALQACGFDLDVRLTLRDDSDERFFVQYRAMTLEDRLQSLLNMLAFEREAHRALRVGRHGRHG